MLLRLCMQCLLKLEIYTNLTDKNNPTSGNCILTKNGTLENRGINYIKLDSSISLQNSTYYSIVFTLAKINQNNASIMLDTTKKQVILSLVLIILMNIVLQNSIIPGFN